MRQITIVVIACAFFAASAHAVRELMIIEQPEPAQRVEGVVLDPTGAPITGMTVTDRSEGCQIVIRSTRTDRKGHFRFPKQQGRTIYCLRFDHPLWNPLEMRLKLDAHAPQKGITAKPEIGG